jgi:hypothetical protein
MIMVTTTGRTFIGNRLTELEQTVGLLTGRLGEMEGELSRVKAEPIAMRLWRNVVNHRMQHRFMSEVCNRRIRPNMKVVSHGHSIGKI